MPTNIQTGGLTSQTLDGADGATNTNIIYGDANKLKGNSVGGADIITGGDDGAINYIYGDAYSMEGKSKGGADYLIGGANGATNYIFGDAYSMKGKVKGGNDILVGVNGSKNIIYGDAYIMRDGARGGDDEFHMDDGASISFPQIFTISSADGEVSKSQSASYSISDNSFIGDASIISNSKAGNDKINLSNDIQINIGNIESISFTANSITRIDSDVNIFISDNILTGDGKKMNNSDGGDDIISVGNYVMLNVGIVDSTIPLAFYSILNSNLQINNSVKNNILIGDANTMRHSDGGNDVLNLNNNNEIFIGLAASYVRISGSAISTTQSFFSISDNFLSGDADNMMNSNGGDDTINFTNDISFNIEGTRSIPFFSSSSTLTSIATASVDLTISGNTVLGDSKLMSHSQGGDDVINVCNNFVSHHGEISNNYFAPTITPYSFVFTLTDNNLYGDAETMIHSKGGDDQLSIGVGIFGDSPFTLNIFDNTLYGDAKTMKKSSGGNDILTGADGKGSITYLYGDAQFTDGKSKAGDDKLISGQGDDQMWGDFGSVVSTVVASNDDDDEDDNDDRDEDDDHCSSNVNKYAGKDTFVFAANNGKDTIFDFQRGLDKIELKGLAGFQAFSDLIYAPSATQLSDLVIDLGDGNSITLVGVNNLEASDFVFA